MDNEVIAESLLMTWVKAVGASRAYPRVGRRSLIEDGPAIARCLDTLDGLARLNDTELWAQARSAFDRAAGLIRERQFQKAYQVLEELRWELGSDPAKRAGRA